MLNLFTPTPPGVCAHDRADRMREYLKMHLLQTLRFWRWLQGFGFPKRAKEGRSTSPYCLSLRTTVTKMVATRVKRVSVVQSTPLTVGAQGHASRVGGGQAGIGQFLALHCRRVTDPSHRLFSSSTIILQVATHTVPRRDVFLTVPAAHVVAGPGR